MSDFTHWTNPKHSIKITAITDLGMTTTDYGFVKRQIGISKALIEKIDFDSEEDAIETLLPLGLQGEEGALEALATFFEDAEEEFSELERERFFPAIQFNVSFDNDLDVTIFALVNERNAGAAEWLRFVALLLPEECETYQLERSD